MVIEGFDEFQRCDGIDFKNLAPLFYIGVAKPITFWLSSDRIYQVQRVSTAEMDALGDLGSDALEAPRRVVDTVIEGCLRVSHHHGLVELNMTTSFIHGFGNNSKKQL